MVHMRITDRLDREGSIGIQGMKYSRVGDQSDVENEKGEGGKDDYFCLGQVIDDCGVF